MTLVAQYILRASMHREMPFVNGRLIRMLHPLRSLHTVKDDKK